MIGAFVWKMNGATEGILERSQVGKCMLVAVGTVVDFTIAGLFVF